MIKNLNEIKKIYDKGANIIEHLKEEDINHNIDDMVLISYDFQAGSYIKKSEENPEAELERADVYSEIFNNLGSFDSIMEVGVGEATTFSNVIKKLNNNKISSFGFDISYSRIQYGQQYLKSKNNYKSLLFTGNFLNCPIQNDMIDIVYSNHSLEPNRGNEKEILTELFRITRKYLVLIEPIYELAGEKGKSHMDKHGYVKNLHKIAQELGYKVIDYRILFEGDFQGVNNTGIVLIEKNSDELSSREDFSPFGCPITKLPLSLIKGHYFCKESLLLYPIVNNIPCLLPENAIIATHFLD